jgi:hypothetical protein
MGMGRDRIARLRIVAVLAAFSLHLAPGASAELGFVAIVEKLRAGQKLTSDEAALYSSELQRLMGKMANGQILTPHEKTELEALGQPSSGQAPASGGSSP